MVRTFITEMRQMFEGDPAIRKVADDPVLSAELLLLFHMILADGVVLESELDMFKRICREAFGIDDDGFDKVVTYLHDFDFETSEAHAMSIFKHLSEKRKKALVHHMLDIAKADELLHDQERQLLRRTLDVLGYSES